MIGATCCGMVAMDTATMLDRTKAAMSRHDHSVLGPRMPLGVTTSACCACIALVIALVSCGGQRRDVAPRELEQVAWWVEDLAHGKPRTATELVVADASGGMLRIARWAHGRDDQREEIPRAVARRRDRWPPLRALIADGLVVSDTASGGLFLAPGSERHGQRALAESLVAEENGERESIDLFVLSLGDADDAATLRYRVAVRAARLELDGR